MVARRGRSWYLSGMRTMLLLAALCAGVAHVLPAQAPPADQAAAPVRAAAPRPKPTGSMDLGYVSATGNSRVTTASLGQRFSFKPSPRWHIRQDLRTVYGEANGRVNTSLLVAKLYTDWTIVDGLGLTSGFTYDRNRSSGIKRRTEEYLGIVWRFTTLARDSLRFDAGSQWTQQRNLRGQENDFISVKAGIWYKKPLANGAFIQQSVEALPNTEVRQDWRVNTETAVAAPLHKRLGLRLAYTVRYDNLPEENFQKSDQIFTAGMQISY
jgi:putative salt-induced outer membrane protein YdiY